MCREQSSSECRSAAQLGGTSTDGGFVGCPWQYVRTDREKKAELSALRDARIE